MDEKQQTPKPPWLRDLWLVLALIAAGMLCPFVGLGVGLGAGSSPARGDDWLVPLAELVAVGVPIIAFIIVIWIFVRPPR